jgi:hypothetical protein
LILELRKETRRTLDGGRRRVTEERRGRVRATEVFGEYLDVDKLSDTDRKLTGILPRSSRNSRAVLRWLYKMKIVSS